MKVTATLDRETKSKVRYFINDVWGTIYIPKSELTTPYPEKITLEVTALE